MAKKFAVSTLGCKLNFSESSAFVRELIGHGYTESTSAEGVDLIVVNTCAVTQQAEKKCRQTIKHMIKQSPEAKVMVTGCFSQLSAERIADIRGVDIVLGNEEKISLIDYVEGAKKDKAQILVSDYNNIKSFKPSYSSEGRTRCFLKVQDGCDYFCTYCTIPLARGKSRSATIAATLVVAQEALSTGVKELILTGVNIGTFGEDTGETFIDLIKALDAIEGDFRVRLGSVEPELLKNEIIDFVAQSKRIAPHFHIPLQSGSNDVLLLMKRHYTRELFAQRIARIREVLPFAFIGVDVIVGMNGETDAMFEDAYQFIEQLSFSQLHVFSYSERPDTRALKLTPKNTPQVKKERSQRLLDLSKKKHHDFYQENLGRTGQVIFEEHQRDEMMRGYTDNYVRVKTAYDHQQVGIMQDVEVKEDNIVW
ncbi:MAG: tRNA (N(6)-L-threonylcarbamoyladenosine(37)-C(2))-methylthiotransferase MtaB [Bacteroidales bacterium]|jgi:threonylcarbamoyladenosine tRNA methylthiotransferase MtaB|nr:tRNA (N(6)-L-threonylcarbamoyladenosine(37)-C(2))-methylthiotransferase MtaB [Bacteroidales bacterium]